METIKLDFPINCNGYTISEINIRRPKVADIKLAGGDISNPDNFMKLIRNLAEIDLEVIDEMDFSDWIKVQKKFNAFFPKG